MFIRSGKKQVHLTKKKKNKKWILTCVLEYLVPVTQKRTLLFILGMWRVEQHTIINNNL